MSNAIFPSLLEGHNIITSVDKNIINYIHRQKKLNINIQKITINKTETEKNVTNF